jgi:hypothetical protein
MIDLREHPEYWERLSGLSEVIRPLVTLNSSSPYYAWLRAELGQDHATAAARVEVVRKMIREIRANGYDAERWRTDPREIGSSGPILVVVFSDGRVDPWDGAHRSCILLHLGLPVEAEEQ